MDKITDYSRDNAPTHAVAEFYARGAEGRAKTYCGRTINGHTGMTIAPGITCGSCKRSMRKDGWMV